VSGAKIVEALREAAAWADGKGTMLVTTPGCEPRMITAEELQAEMAAEQASRNAKSPPRPKPGGLSDST
jgi:hypothetical protein